MRIFSRSYILRGVLLILLGVFSQGNLKCDDFIKGVIISVRQIENTKSGFKVEFSLENHTGTDYYYLKLDKAYLTFLFFDEKGNRLKQSVVDKLSVEHDTKIDDLSLLEMGKKEIGTLTFQYLHSKSTSEKATELCDSIYSSRTGLQYYINGVKRVSIVFKYEIPDRYFDLFSKSIIKPISGELVSQPLSITPVD